MSKSRVEVEVEVEVEVNFFVLSYSNSYRKLLPKIEQNIRFVRAKQEAVPRVGSTVYCLLLQAVDCGFQ